MEHKMHAAGGSHGNPYARLLWMLLLSFAAMYALMYAMVDRFDNVLGSVNQFYMAGLMAAPMAIIELALMRAMYPRKRLNAAIMAVSIVLLAVFWIGIRQQAAVNDTQFLRSMIPHHAGAILMCGRNHLADPQLRQLCKDIMVSQQAEITLMKSKLAPLDR